MSLLFQNTKEDLAECRRSHKPPSSESDEFETNGLELYR